MPCHTSSSGCSSSSGIDSTITAATTTTTTTTTSHECPPYATLPYPTLPLRLMLRLQELLSPVCDEGRFGGQVQELQGVLHQRAQAEGYRARTQPDTRYRGERGERRGNCALVRWLVRWFVRTCVDSLVCRARRLPSASAARPTTQPSTDDPLRGASQASGSISPVMPGGGGTGIAPAQPQAVSASLLLLSERRSPCTAHRCCRSEAAARRVLHDDLHRHLHLTHAKTAPHRITQEAKPKRRSILSFGRSR